MNTLAGDCLLASAFVAYAGYFDQEMRSSLGQAWQERLMEAEIDFRKSLNQSEYLSTVDKRMEWQKNNLPVDELCIENAIMLERYNRYPLIVDPSGSRSKFWFFSIKIHFSISKKQARLLSSLWSSMQTRKLFRHPFWTMPLENSSNLVCDLAIRFWSMMPNPLIQSSIRFWTERSENRAAEFSSLLGMSVFWKSIFSAFCREIIEFLLIHLVSVIKILICRRLSRFSWPHAIRHTSSRPHCAVAWLWSISRLPSPRCSRSVSAPFWDRNDQMSMLNDLICWSFKENTNSGLDNWKNSFYQR